METIPRCKWAQNVPPIHEKYHDTEWGVPCRDDEKLYEMLLLECFQAGLSWLIVLQKREAFRAAFDNFDAQKIAKYDREKIDELLQNKAVIRCRRKIEAAIGNANVYLDIKRSFGSFSAYLWGFTDGKIIFGDGENFPTSTPLSDKISKDLKKRGMKYVGTVTIYSYLQAVGIVNDHEKNCICYNERGRT
ncbi:MAG: DNA-3-methyladenine glycosylase I [Ruminococcaceae bacterium]|nr:DNA-3-methyladenine glycosylase I [Oscillospiraceae bacterium]